MQTFSYDTQKEKAINLFNQLRGIFNKLPNEIKEGIDFQKLEGKIESIKNKRFKLLIAGESKSGKSTFINALLKTNILPVDVVECTSAIIEISYSNEKKLTYYTADGNSHEITEEDEIQNFLKENAMINQTYNRIPTSAIDQFIIDHRGDVSEEDINTKIGELQDRYTFGLEGEYHNLIRQYINEKAPIWADIVVKIGIEYPFDPMLKNYIIVDSPGVHTLGDVGNLTKQYIEKADAVIFIKSIASASTSAPFLSFLNETSQIIDIDNTFLLLSRVTDCNATELNTLLETAKECFNDAIHQERIIAIDSLVQMNYNEFKDKNKDEIEQIIRSRRQEKKGFPFVSSAFFLEQSLESFFDVLKKTANFDEFIRIFEGYALDAPHIALRNLINDLIEICNNLLTTASISMDEITNYLNSLNELNVRLNILQTDLNITLLKIKEEYTGSVAEEDNAINEGIIRTKLREIVDKIRNSLDQVTTTAQLRKEIGNITNPLSEFKREIAAEFLEKCKENLSVKCEQISFPPWMTGVLAPVITSAEIDDIIKELEKKDNQMRIVKIIRRLFKKDSLFDEIKQDTKNLVDDRATLIHEQLVRFLSTIINKYNEKLRLAILSVNIRLNDLRNDNANNIRFAEIKNELETLKSEVEDVIVKENRS